MSFQHDKILDRQEDGTSFNIKRKNEETMEEVATPPATSEVPNGGFAAWLQVVGAFCLFFNTW